VKKPELGPPLKENFTKDQGKSLSLDCLELLEPEKSLAQLHATYSFAQGNMVSLILLIILAHSPKETFLVFLC
jgi:hypothetical protein